MRELIALWRNTRMVVLVAQIAALYAAVCIPFKLAVIVPGITEVRPGAVVPVVCGFLFGPAAAWGSAFGNLIADFFGTLGPGSLFGFAANFLYAYVAYRVWKLLAPRQPDFRAVGPEARMLGAVLLGNAGEATLVFMVLSPANTVLQPVLAPYAYWFTLLSLLFLNFLLLRLVQRTQPPANLEEVMDRNTAVAGILTRNAILGLAVASVPLLALWSTQLSPVLTLAVCEGVVVANALLLSGPLWTVVRRNQRTRVATSSIARLVGTAFVACAVCALGVGFGVEVVGVAPFQIVSPIVLINNFVLTCLLAPILLAILHPRLSRWGLLTEDVLPPDMRSEPIAPTVGLIIVAVAACLGLVVGCWLGFAPAQAVMSLASLGLNISPHVPLWKATLPFVLIMLGGVSLL